MSKGKTAVHWRRGHFITIKTKDGEKKVYVKPHVVKNPRQGK